MSGLIKAINVKVDGEIGQVLCHDGDNLTPVYVDLMAGKEVEVVFKDGTHRIIVSRLCSMIEVKYRDYTK